MRTLLQRDICVSAGRLLLVKETDGDCFSVILGQAYYINRLAANIFNLRSSEHVSRCRRTNVAARHV